jgi:hypothetical protein
VDRVIGLGDLIRSGWAGYEKRITNIQHKIGELYPAIRLYPWRWKAIAMIMYDVCRIRVPTSKWKSS